MSLLTTQSFETLKQTFSGDLVTPNDPDYGQSIRRWSATAERPAGLVAFVKTDEDVSKAIKFATENKLEIAVKGGGHNPSGASSTDGGIVIDLSRYMNKATCDPDSKIVTVGGGALWSDVDKATTEFGLATVCGTVSHTGVGGLTVGGGYGHLTGEFGLVIDNLIGATVVLADGSIVKASNSENSDLFWAIRGGGVNFGIVTTFNLKCHPQIPNVFFGELIFPGDKWEEIVKIADRFEKEKLGRKQLLLVGLLSTPHGIMVLTGLFHNGSEEEGKELYKEFYDVGPVKDNSGSKPYIQLNQRLDQVQAHGTNVYMCAANQAIPAPEICRAVFDNFTQMISSNPEYEGSFILFEYYHTDVVKQVKSDETAFNCRSYHNNAVVIMKWKEGNGNFETAKKWAKKISGVIDPGLGTLETPYGNYESDVKEGGEKVKKLFGSNYPRLQSIKAKYDPNQVFNKWFPIVPAQ